jgi:hypothetical protein
MNKKILLLMAFTISCLTGCAQKAPTGRLIYCSYSENRHAGLGRSYCELIADNPDSAKISARYDIECRFAEETRKEVPVNAEEVAELEELLKQQKVWKLNGYHKEELMEGGTTHRIHIEYSDGRKVTASWYAHRPKEAAQIAYNTISFFLDKRLKEAKTDSIPE